MRTSFRNSILSKSAPALLVLLTWQSTAFSQEDSTAITLLQGVNSSREALDECSFQMTANGTWGGIGEDTVFHVRYGGDEVLIKRDDGRATMLADGEAFYYNPNSCTIKDPEDTGVGFLIDPRILGISIGYWSSVDLESALRSGNRESVELLESDTIRNVKCAKVRVVDKWGEVKTFWIDPNNSFRVLRCEHRVEGAVGVTESFYESEDSVLPSRVETENSTTDGERLYTLNLELSNVSFRPDPCAFDLSSLGLKVGTPVSDIRIHERLGYWDGNGLDSVSRKSPLKPEAANSGIAWPWIFLCVASVLCVASIAVLRRSQTGAAR